MRQAALQLDFFDDVYAGSEYYKLDDYSFLRQKVRTQVHSTGLPIRIVDLFSGCGGLSLGIEQACQLLGRSLEIALAVDSDPVAAECYAANFPRAKVATADISALLSESLDAPLTETERALSEQIGPVDVLVGGPPCQGHSDLNNSTRRSDPKNALFVYMARAAQIFEPNHVLIENVAGAVHDHGRAVQNTVDYMVQAGYHVSLGIVNLARIGVPQQRKRLLIIASKDRAIDIRVLELKYRTEPRSVRWAIEDLMSIEPKGIFDEPCKSSLDNKRRMEYLLVNGLYDLPNEERPACHRDKPHSYKSIYGRLSWDNPAQTVTSGFYNMSMGRYVHPALPRTLTAHEAARLQFFPDFFDFSIVRHRTNLATIIGNAVPVKLGCVCGIELLSPEVRN